MAEFVVKENLVPENVGETIIWGKDLTKQFDEDIAVKKVNLNIPRGLIFGFVGPSGCGKTTIVRLLTGIYRPTSGEVRVMDRPPTQFTRHDREKIGYMPQQFVLYPNLTVWENINFAASAYGVWRGRSARLGQLLEVVELQDHKNKLARKISGGMQRRLSLASALIHQPELVFLDEPTTGIDPILRKKFWDYFGDLRQNGTTFFVTTQYVSDAAYCDLVGVMMEGRLLVVDTPQGLRRQALGGEIVVLKTNQPIDYKSITQLNQLPFVQKKIERLGENEVNIVVEKASTALPAIVEWCRDNELSVHSIQEYLPPFDDVFVTLIRRFSGNE